MTFSFKIVSLQIKALPAGLDNIILVDDEVRRKTYAVGSQGGGGVDTSGKKWKTGELEFEALMRQLDNAVRNKENLRNYNQFCSQKLSMLETVCFIWQGGGIYFVVCFQWLGETFFSKLRIFSID